MKTDDLVFVLAPTRRSFERWCKLNKDVCATYVERQEMLRGVDPWGVRFVVLPGFEARVDAPAIRDAMECVTRKKS